ncbi:MAG: cation transporter [Gammaproteobacteria bacterium]|nr:cation transporter [Gammaproteobacteria bacterium]
MKHAFHIGGVCCGNSIVKALKAIRSVADVTQARIDLAKGLAHVEGEADPAAVVAALTQAGFSAAPAAKGA